MKTLSKLLLVTIFLGPLTFTQTGCFWLTAQGPNLGPLAIPVPVPVGIQKQKEDQFWNYERYERAPVLGPIPPGGPTEALDEPSEPDHTQTHSRSTKFPILHDCSCLSYAICTPGHCSSLAVMSTVIPFGSSTLKAPSSMLVTSTGILPANPSEKIS